jgi:probable HAF family extracellular repeat protein
MTSTKRKVSLLARHVTDTGYKICGLIITRRASLLLLAILISAYFGVIMAQEPAEDQFYDVDVVNLSSLGGTHSKGNGVNNRGWVMGYSNLAGNTRRQATLWRDGELIPLGTLGGPNSSVGWPVKNNRGIIVGVAQTDRPEPLGETWSCRIFFPPPNNVGYTCLGFVWEDGRMRKLPTLGGNNGFAAAANNVGQVVGWAETSVRDPQGCEAPQVLQFKAVIWGPGKDEIQALPPLPGDTSGSATAINDRGVVAGISGRCDMAVGRHTARRAVIWENGMPTDIGNLGGDSWNTPTTINQRGDVAGFAITPGSDPDNPTLHAFLWTKEGGIQELKPLTGDTDSQASGINERRQVVGLSCGASGCRAVLWENGVTKALRAAPGYNARLEWAVDINDIGEITGRAIIDPATLNRVAFLATPVKQ